MRLYFKLAVLFAVLTFSFSACDKNYLSEKAFYKAGQEAKKLDLNNAGSADIDNVIRLYRVVVKKYPLTKKAAEAHFIIANLLIKDKRYNQARDELKNIVLNFHDNKKLASEAMKLTAISFLLEGNVESAVAEYKKIMEEYPLTEIGLKAPMSVVEIYKKMSDEDAVKKVYAEGIEFYDKLLGKLGPISASAVVANYKALFLYSKGDTEGAVSVWEDIIASYEKSPIIPVVAIGLGDLYAGKLKDGNKAIEKYRFVIDNYPGTVYEVNAYRKLLKFYYSRGTYQLAYDTAEKLYGLVKGKDKNFEAEAKLAMARIYEKMGEWGKCEAVLDEIASSYQDTPAALKVPLIMISHYLGRSDGERADAVSSEALKNFEKILGGGESSQFMKDQAFDIGLVMGAQTKNWEGVAELMRKLYENKSADEKSRARALFTMGYLYDKKLNNAEKAKFYYDKLKTEFPKAPYLKLMEKIKDNNSEVGDVE